MSEEPLDYVSLVLYVKRGVPLCERLLLELAGDLSVAVQDIDAVPERPDWLRGVPTCVRMPGGKVLVGSEAVKAVRAHCASRGPSGLQLCAGGCRAEAFSIGSDGEGGIASYGASRTEEAFPLPTLQEPLQEKKKGRGSLDLEELLRLRGQ